MALLISTDLSGKYFSCSIPDVEFTISGTTADVTMTVDGQQIYSETLYPIDGKIKIRDISNLVTPYAKLSLIISLSVSIQENIDSGTGGTANLSATVIFCKADFNTNNEAVDVSGFCDSHFLSILLGKKITADGRLEFLHYLGNDTPSVIAEYADGTTKTFTPPVIQGNNKYISIDVSPNRFKSEGRKLVGFTAKAGSRSQEFVMDLDAPDCAPILIFENSFGCEELVYCTGTHKVAPSYKRNNTYIDGLLKNYDIEETRTFKADTGFLNMAMANWLDDLFRSTYVRIVNIYDGMPNVGKEIILSDSKSEYGNDDDEMPRFTFSYRYAQRNQNVVDLHRAGRIFDNTFDFTFN